GSVSFEEESPSGRTRCGSPVTNVFHELQLEGVREQAANIVGVAPVAWPIGPGGPGVADSVHDLGESGVGPPIRYPQSPARPTRARELSRHRGVVSGEYNPVG